MNLSQFATVFLLLFHLQTFAADFDFIMLRHARAPGTGDPQNFQLKDCRTQRNLSQEGLAQAKKIGLELPAKIKIYSSKWCRCLETAKNRFSINDRGSQGIC
jgi:broad specificity phosphatase PhoE